MEQILHLLSRCPRLREMVRYWAYRPPVAARCEPLPVEIDNRLAGRLLQKGIRTLYSHQAEAVDQVWAGRDVTVVTPTASGKSLCFNLPVLDGLLKNPEARALYLFPTKALAHDQFSSLAELCDGLLQIAVSDGDTPAPERRSAAEKARLVITNPDMLHHRMLPDVGLWGPFISNLRFLVLDELHVYRGVFGAHVANTLRRLMRLVSNQRAGLRFISCSGTIGNPGELARSLLGRETRVIDRNGGPSGGRHLLIMDPYHGGRRTNNQHGTRFCREGAAGPCGAGSCGAKGQCFVGEVQRLVGWADPFYATATLLALIILKSGEQGIIFAHRRQELELLLAKVRKTSVHIPQEMIQGYRGGYLASERRGIEEGLRRGRVRLVVATNALELGVDLGNIRVCIICGWPGSTASLWQQAGRVGRAGQESLTILLTGKSPLDRYISASPEAVLTSAPEPAFVNPDNPIIAIRHIRAANRERPFRRDEPFGTLLPEAFRHLLPTFTSPKADGAGDRFSLRGGTREAELVLQDHAERVIGRTDDNGLLSLGHRGALYLHNAKAFRVTGIRRDREGLALHEAGRDEPLHLSSPCVATAVTKPFSERCCTVSHIPGCGRVAAHLGAAEMVRRGTAFRIIDPDTGRMLSWGRAEFHQARRVRAWWLSLPPGIEETLDIIDFNEFLATIGYYLCSMARSICLCDRSDIIATSYRHDPTLGQPTVYLCETWPGGTGVADALFHNTSQFLKKTLIALGNDPHRHREKALFQALLSLGTA